MGVGIYPLTELPKEKYDVNIVGSGTELLRWFRIVPVYLDWESPGYWRGGGGILAKGH